MALLRPAHGGEGASSSLLSAASSSRDAAGETNEGAYQTAAEGFGERVGTGPVQGIYAVSQAGVFNAEDGDKKDEKKDEEKESAPTNHAAVMGAAAGALLGALIGFAVAGPFGAMFGMLVGVFAGAAGCAGQI